MSMLRDALDALRASEEDCFGEEATYRSADGTRLGVKAVPGRTVFSQRNDYGTFVRVETRDFIIRRECLPAEPAKGDEIAFGGRVYEVIAPNGEPAWRWSDALETAYRLHTKLVGEEENG